MAESVRKTQETERRLNYRKAVVSVVLWGIAAYMLPHGEREYVAAVVELVKLQDPFVLGGG